MNQHVDGAIIFKDHLDARVRTEPKPKPKREAHRRPLGLAPVADDVSPASALDGVSADVLASPACLRDVLESLDASISIRSDADVPLKLRLSRLESANDELRSELAAAKATIETLQAAHAKTETTVGALRFTLPRKGEVEARVAAEVRAQLVAMHAERIARRARQKATS